MKHLYCLLLLTLYCLSGCEDVEDVQPLLPKETSTPHYEETDNYCCYSIPEQPPQFPGGDKALKDFIRDNLQWGQTSECVTGRVFVRFIVNTDGSVSDAEVFRGISDSCDRAALEVIQKLPDFIPGKILGQPMRIRMIVPVYFRFGECLAECKT